MSYEWQPPCLQKAARPELACNVVGGWHIRAFPTSSADSLGSVAAREAFWQLGPAMLQKLAKVIGMQTPKGLDTFELIHSMVMHQLKCSEAEALQICEKRPPPLGVGTVVWVALGSMCGCEFNLRVGSQQSWCRLPARPSFSVIVSVNG